ncbi:HupE/UreJ family protein [Haliea sp. E17]|uniref:HupE/UreJ family protein n=1 Tax=Haliea sp. E17 TaxID=3401576 RepID=UPI003AAFEBD0
MRAILTWLLGGLLCVALPASAHLLNMTKANGTIDDGGEFTLELSLDLLRASGSAQAYYELSLLQQPLAEKSLRAQWQTLGDAVEVRQGSKLINLETTAVEPPRGLALADFESPVMWPMTAITLRGRVDPAQPMSVSFRSRFAFEEPIALSLVASGGERKQSRLLVANQSSPPFLPLVNPAVTPGEAPSFDVLHNLGVGIVHILPGGVDHLLFLVCLFLLARSWKQLLLFVSAFTLAHSLTLALAAYRLVEVPAGIVESLIAASILWLAVCVLLGRHAHASLGLITGFGLLHGLGFASALRSLPLEDNQFLWTLLTFNAGVEIGQVIFLAGLWLCLAWCRGRQWYPARVQRPVAVAVALVSSVWLVQRLASL